MARALGDPAGEAYALYWLGAAARYVGDPQAAEGWLRQVQRIDQAAIPGWIIRPCTIHLAAALSEAGEAAEAQRYCADALAQAQQAGALFDQGDCLSLMAWLDLAAGRPAAAGAHLRQALAVYAHTSASVLLLNCLGVCGDLCAAARRWRETITVWAACDAVSQAARIEVGANAAAVEAHRGLLREARQALGPAAARAAEERGAAMIGATAAEYALLLVTQEAGEPGRAGPAAAQRPRTRTGHPGRPRPHRHPDRRTALHQRPDRPLPPGPDPRQDRMPPSRRPHPPRPRVGPGLTPYPEVSTGPRPVGSCYPTCCYWPEGVTRPLPRSIAGQATCESPADLSRRPEKQEQAGRRKGSPLTHWRPS